MASITANKAGTAAVAEPIDPCAINTAHHNMTPLGLSFAHENTTQQITVTHNGNPITIENVVGPITVDASGLMTFGAGPNNVYNKRANAVEYLDVVGDYYEFRTNRPAAFRTLQMQITEDPTLPANGPTVYYKIVVTSSGITVSKAGTGAVYSTNLTPAGTQRTLRVERSLTGIEVSFEGVVVYTTPVDCFDYEGEQNARIAVLEQNVIAVANGTTGEFRVGRFSPLAPIIVDGSTVSTGLDLTEFPQMQLRILGNDITSNRPWQIGMIDVTTLLERFNAGDTVDAFMHIYDNDFITLNVVDPVAGDIAFADSGRQMQIAWVELWVNAVASPSISLMSPDGTEWLLTVDNSGALTTTAV